MTHFTVKLQSKKASIRRLIRSNRLTFLLVFYCVWIWSARLEEHKLPYFRVRKCPAY